MTMEAKPLLLQTLPARHGWNWIKDAARLYAKAPMAWAGTVLLSFLAVALIGNIPVVGLIVANICLPALLIGFMNGARDLAHGEKLKIAHLVSGFRMHIGTLLVLGLFYLLAYAAVLGVTALVDGGLLLRWILLREYPTREVMATTEVLISTLLAAVLFMPVMMTFCSAPALAAWHGMSAAKSLFFSFAATLRNTRAFVVYGLVLFVLTTVLPILLTMVLILLLNAVTPELLSLLYGPLFLTLIPIIFASFYTSYADVFDDH